jgi:ketosteroid isomerase-like protein
VIAVDIGERFLHTLHDPGVDARIRTLRSMCTPDATWWVDTGRDRKAGVLGVNPGDARPWPLHGTMTVQEKFDRLKMAASNMFPAGVGLTIAPTSFGTDTVAVVEGEGFGYTGDRRVYNNRYAFVFDVADGLFTSIREYMDTLHAHDIFGSSGESKPTIADAPMPQPPDLRDENESLLSQVWSCLSGGDIDGFAGCFAPNATWWTDSGRERIRGRFDLMQTAMDGTPFHGVVPMSEKVAYIRSRMSSSYEGRTITVAPYRFISGGDRVAAEAVGYALLGNGRTYQNRYLLIADIADGYITQIREYCDTLHVADVTGL